jgi:hypothetical protein
LSVWLWRNYQEKHQMTLEMTRKAVEAHLNAIAVYFKDGTQFTFIARTPGNDCADFVVSTDDLEEAKATLQRRSEAR